MKKTISTVGFSDTCMDIFNDYHTTKNRIRSLRAELRDMQKKLEEVKYDLTKQLITEGHYDFLTID